MCGGNLDLELEVAVFDYESDGKHVVMGELETSVNELTKKARSGGLTLIKNGDVTGKIAVLSASVSGNESGNELVDISSIPLLLLVLLIVLVWQQIVF